MFALFGKNGVEVRDATMGDFAIKEKVWALSDSCGSNIWPCQSFITASTMKNAWLMHAAPLAKDKWYPLFTNRETICFVMDCITYDEIKALGLVILFRIVFFLTFSRSTLLGLKVEHFLKKWGPNAYTCIQLARGVLTEHELQYHAEIAALEFAKNPTAMTPETKSEFTFYTLFTARPIDEEKRFTYVLRVETQYLRDHVVDKVAQLGRIDMQVSFYSQASRSPRFEGSMGYVFEKFVYAWLSSNPAERELVCRAADPNAVERIRLKPIGRDRLHIITGTKRLGEAKEPEDKLPFGWILASESFPSVDAIVCVDTHVITIQLTTTSNHYANEKDLGQIKECLPDKIRNTPRIHYR
jgi:hypothetical protein